MTQYETACNEKLLPLVVLTGPTAAGKTNLSIQLAKAIQGEIISADSMQVYRGMDIGTAKIKPEEMQGVPHHLIDICDPTEDYNVVRFATEAKRLIREITSRGHIPILVGGTGFYIQAVLYDIDFTENNEQDGIREELEAFAAEKGAEALHERLKQLDFEAAQAIHPNNVKRVIRAIEFAMQTGGKISAHNEEQRAKQSAYNSAYFVLSMERSVLYERIEKRIDQMMEEGLLSEVKGFYDRGFKEGMVSMQGLGYKEFFPYFRGEATLEDAVYCLKRDTRHFAKRQLTWFKREKEVIWVEKDHYPDEQAILLQLLDEIKKRGMIDTDSQK